MIATAQIVDKLVESKSVQSFDDLAMITYINGVYLSRADQSHELQSYAIQITKELSNTPEDEFLQILTFGNTIEFLFKIAESLFQGNKRDPKMEENIVTCLSNLTSSSNT